MWNPVAQAVLWASSGWVDNSHTSVMKTRDPDLSSWLILATSVAFSELRLDSWQTFMHLSSTASLWVWSELLFIYQRRTEAQESQGLIH